MNDPDTDQNQDELFSLRPYFDTLRRYKRVIVVGLAASLTVWVIAILTLWLWLPLERLGSIQFRLAFEGAAEGRYPNGMPFAPTEIVGAPVIMEVFKANDLQRYGKYWDFKEALFVQRSNPELDMLGHEYMAKLADTKLLPADRSKLEDEFKMRREALTDPSFSLSLRESARFLALPRELGQKVLTDTLSTWAQQATLRKGVLKYQVPVLSVNILSRQSLETDDYLVAVDQLRTKAVRIIRTIDELEKIPGAMNLRTNKDNISLSEIRANLEDSIRFDLESLLGIIRSEGITKNARLLSLYASNMVFQLRLDRQETDGRAKALQAALREYVAQTGPQTELKTKAGTAGGDSTSGGLVAPTFIPQLSESFLGRLQELSVTTQKGEMEYRRKLTDQVIEETRRVATFDKDLVYYEDLAKALVGVGSRAAGTPVLVDMIKTRTQKSFEEITKATTQLSDLYNELSAQNLGTAAGLYAITGPFAQHTRRSVSIRSVTLSFVWVLMVTLVSMLVGCLMHNAMRKTAATRE